MSTIQVRIYDTPLGPYVDCEPVHIHGPNDQIEWVYPVGGNFDIDFGVPGPFGAGHFDRSNPHSGPPTVPSNPKKVYKYSVKTPSGTIDPGVIVH